MPPTVASSRPRDNGDAVDVHIDDHPVKPDDLAAALAVFRAIHGKQISKRTRNLVNGLTDPRWIDPLEFIEASTGATTPEQRLALLKQWVNGAKSRHPAEVKVIQRALDLVHVDIGVKGIEDEPDDSPKPFTLGLVNSPTFLSETYDLEWLAEGLLARDETAVMGGPSKSLKTSILVALVLSLGTARRFLNRFWIPKPARCALLSGESGRRAIQSTARQVCASLEVDPSEVNNVYWGFTLPQVNCGEHMDVLRRTIADNEIEFIGFDPWYLMLLAGAAGINVNSMHEMGPILRDLSELCLGEGATPMLAHHYRKHREDPFAVPEMSELAHAGIAQYMRQWMLIGPRQRYDSEIGKFFLYLNYGGSAGHSGELAVDIEVGRLEADMDRRKWIVTVHTPSEERAAQEEQRQTQQQEKAAERRRVREADREAEEREMMGRAVDAFRAAPGCKLTVRKLRDALSLGPDRAGRVIYLLEQSGAIVPTTILLSAGRGGPREYPGYELVVGREAVR